MNLGTQPARRRRIPDGRRSRRGEGGPPFRHGAGARAGGARLFPQGRGIARQFRDRPALRARPLHGLAADPYADACSAISTRCRRAGGYRLGTALIALGVDRAGGARRAPSRATGHARARAFSNATVGLGVRDRLEHALYRMRPRRGRHRARTWMSVRASRWPAAPWAGPISPSATQAERRPSSTTSARSTTRPGRACATASNGRWTIIASQAAPAPSATGSRRSAPSRSPSGRAAACRRCRSTAARRA